MNKKFIDNINLKNKNILLRVDFNVPMDKEKKNITNHNRIKSTLPTIDYLLQQDINNLVIVSHLGRPKGKIVPELSLKLVQEYLQKEIKQNIDNYLPIIFKNGIRVPEHYGNLIGKIRN